MLVLRVICYAKLTGFYSCNFSFINLKYSYYKQKVDTGRLELGPEVENFRR